jgi:hypothetical protein
VGSCGNGQGAREDEIRSRTKAEVSNDETSENKKLMWHQHLQRTGKVDG